MAGTNITGGTVHATNANALPIDAFGYAGGVGLSITNGMVWLNVGGASDFSSTQVYNLLFNGNGYHAYTNATAALDTTDGNFTYTGGWPSTIALDKLGPNTLTLVPWSKSFHSGKFGCQPRHGCRRRPSVDQRLFRRRYRLRLWPISPGLAMTTGSLTAVRLVLC